VCDLDPRHVGKNGGSEHKVGAASRNWKPVGLGRFGASRIVEAIKDVGVLEPITWSRGEMLLTPRDAESDDIESEVAYVREALAQSDGSPSIPEPISITVVPSASPARVTMSPTR
jgi:hypothetical protein